MVREIATPRRRSSRIRGMSPEKQTTASTPHLAILEELEDSTQRLFQPSFNSSPSGHDVIKTPTTASRPQPSFEEMHPSRFQNTAKKMASGKRLSTVNARTYMQTPSKSEVLNKQLTHESPCIMSQAQQSFASPGFEFRYRQSTDMSTDTQKMMDDIREQAARIKDGLAARREKQLLEDEETDALYGRKLATPKGKLGRFSDVHLGEFKKMNSIANHASAFRIELSKDMDSTTNLLKTDASKASSGRTNSQVAKSLKRSPSKAELDRPDFAAKKLMPCSFENDVTPEKAESPTKRLKHEHKNSHTAQRPISETGHKLHAPRISQPKSGIPVVSTLPKLATPTKLPLARSASVKNLRTTTSMIPAVAYSPSLRKMATPTTETRLVFPHTENNMKYRDSFTNKLASVKSILRRPQIRFSDDPVKIAAGTHLSTPTKSLSNNHKANQLPSLEEIPPGTPAYRKEKHVNFSDSPAPTKQSSQQGTPATPSPMKMPGGFSVTYPDLHTAIAEPSTPTHPGLGKTTVKTSHATPGDFTFRSDQTLNFAPIGYTTPTIRKVDHNNARIYAKLQSTADKPTRFSFAPHGLSSKKRKRDVAGRDESSEDKENTHTNSTGNDDEQESGNTAKKARFTTDNTPVKSMSNKLKITTPASRIPRQKGRGFLSLSRLNELAKPRERK